MPSYVVRVWMPDRPGALGAVASRIGAVRGDLVGIDILERGAGRAIDELVVDLPDENLVPLLISEIGEVDGVDVEDVRPVAEPVVDPGLDALESAALIVEQVGVADLLEVLARRSSLALQADWAAVVDVSAPDSMLTGGATPPVPWLEAFVAGSRSAVDGDGGPEDVAWAELTAAEGATVIVLGRRGRPFRARERRQLAALARIVNHRWTELIGADA